ncbi:MAG: hypothetical protein ACKO01_05015 [Erythrobacter sp.]
MSRTQIWIAAWLALTAAATLLHSGDMPDVQHLAADLPTYLPSLLLGAAGKFCLYRAIRSGIGELWGGITGRPGKARGGARPFAPLDEEPASDFDADAAFARYMERRGAQAVVEDQPATRAASPAPAPRPIKPRGAQGGFGRKIA